MFSYLCDCCSALAMSSLFEYKRKDYILFSHVELSENYIATLPEKLLMLKFSKDVALYRNENYKYGMPSVTEEHLYAMGKKLYAFGYCMVRIANNTIKVYARVIECEKDCMKIYKQNGYSRMTRVDEDAAYLPLKLFVPRYLLVQTSGIGPDCVTCAKNTVRLTILNKTQDICVNTECEKHKYIPIEQMPVSISDIDLDTLSIIQASISLDENVKRIAIGCDFCRHCKVCARKLSPCKRHVVCTHTKYNKKQKTKKNASSFMRKTISKQECELFNGQQTSAIAIVDVEK